MRRAAFWRVRVSAANAMSAWLCGTVIQAGAESDAEVMLFTHFEECNSFTDNINYNDSHLT